MTSDTVCMRWSPGRKQSWRRTSEGGFDPAHYGVAGIGEATARDWILDRHYSGTWPAARLRYGLFDLRGSDARLAGAAVLSVPVQKRVLTTVFPHLEPYAESLELGRLVLEDAAAANAESWFLGQVWRLAAEAGIRGVVSFSDPVPRRRADGTLFMPGHTGCAYQAKGAHYTGRSTPRTLAVFPDGTVFSARAMQKIRKREQGHEYAEQILIAHGARPMRPGDRPAIWLADALSDTGTRRLRHKGCHRYAFRLGLARRDRKAVVIALPARPYPKIPDLAAA